MMGPECEHFKDCDRLDGGCCAHPKPPFGRLPSYGTCDDCGHNRKRGQMRGAVQVRVPTEAERRKAEADRLDRMRATWAKIHGLAAAGQLTDASLDDALKGLPCGTCRDHFAPVRASEPIPPDAAGQFALTVGWHNVVNAHLDKPLVTVEDAARIYSLKL